jgi:hypothetical protein
LRRWLSPLRATSGVVDEALDQGGSEGSDAADFAPPAKGLLLVTIMDAGADALEEQVGGFGFERDVARLRR